MRGANAAVGGNQTGDSRVPTDESRGAIQVEGKRKKTHRANAKRWNRMPALPTDTFDAGKVYCPPDPLRLETIDSETAKEPAAVLLRAAADAKHGTCIGAAAEQSVD